MARDYFDNVRHAIATTGTGATVTLGSAPSGWRSITTAGGVDGDEVPYEIREGDAWENGVATLGGSGTTISRSVSRSSNSNARINLLGAAVFSVVPTEDTVKADLVSFVWPQSPSGPQITQAMDNLGAGTAGRAVFAATTTSQVQDAAGAGATGKNIFTSTTTSGAQDAAGAGASGKLVFVAATAGAARGAIDAASGTDVRILQLTLADLQGDRLGFLDGIADPLDDEGDINTGTSTGQTYDAVNDWYAPTRGTDALISPTGLTKYSDFGNNSNNWFDGTTNQGVANAAGKSVATNVYGGFNLGTSLRIAKVVAFGSNDQGFVENITPQVTIELRASVSSTPSNFASDGVSLATLAAFTDTANESAGRTVTSGNILTRYGHTWARVTHNGAANTIRVAELQFYSVQYANMDIRSNSFAATFNPTRGRVGFQLAGTDISDGFAVVNTDFKGYVSRDSGTTWTQVTLTEMASGWFEGEADLSAQPVNNSMRWRFETVNNKVVYLMGVVLQWR